MLGENSVSGPGSPNLSPVAPGHPRGLSVLFFTEMWERFSYYGMRALLVLFMVDTTRGGLGLDDKTATAIYGLYTAFVYLLSLPGGWLADRVLGAQRAVWYGGAIIALGHFTLALPFTRTFFLGLIFVVIGSGTLKPNMSALVAELYPEGGARRDAGFSIFYMGVNLGAALGPLVCGWLAKSYGWHWGFGVAGVGMVLGLVQFRWSRRHLGDAGTRRGDETPLRPGERAGLFGGMAAAVIAVALCLVGLIHLDPLWLARGMAYVILALAVGFFAYVFSSKTLDRIEKGRAGVILVLFVASALFWAGFEQAGSSFNLFAERYTIRHFDLLRYEVPAAWFQALPAVLVIVFAPVFAGLWVWLAKRRAAPSIPVKFAAGLLFLSAGFVVMAGASRVVASGAPTAPTWLLTTYLLHTFGELCVSPVGLSSVTKLAPRALTGQMMGVWFLATSLGNLLAGLLAGEFKPDAVQTWSATYFHITILPVAAGLLLIIFAQRINRLTAGAA